MNERRIARIQQQIKERIAIALTHEISDPRMGFVTISRVEMDREMQKCKVFWTFLGDEKRQRLTAAALANAAGFLRKEVAQVLNTRSVPFLEFRFDESVAGAQKMQDLLTELTTPRDPTPRDPDSDETPDREDADEENGENQTDSRD